MTELYEVTSNALEEEIGRGAVLALANNYRSFAEAIQELIDNPIDYMRGRQTRIDVQISKDRKTAVVFDHGGEGMGYEDLRKWIRWGAGEDHSADDIGQYRVGGKLAAVFLGKGLDIISRKSGEEDVYRFTDTKWGTRTDLYAGQVKTIDIAEAKAEIDGFSKLKKNEGFTHLRLNDLQDRRIELGRLEKNLIETYEPLIKDGLLTIALNGRVLMPLVVPMATSVDEITINKINLGGVTIAGRLYAVERNPNGVLKPGVTTYFNRRRITSGEGFGHALSNTGTYQRVSGELHISRIKPNTNKTAWDTDSIAWGKIHDYMHQAMRPLLQQLKQIDARTSVSREQKKRGARVVRDLMPLLRNYLAELNGNGTAQNGRSPAVNSGSKRNISKKDKGRGPIVHRTPAPLNAVGTLLRKVTEQPPRIEFLALGESERSVWREDPIGKSTERVVVINTDFPGYDANGTTEEYLQDTYLFHVLTETSLDAAELRSTVDSIVWQAHLPDKANRKQKVA